MPTLTAMSVRHFHIITPEFPPALGGVSEHSRVLAGAAAERGLEVHVWTAAGAADVPGVLVHPTLGLFDAAGMQRTGRLLDAYPGPRTVVLQWVPHGYGRRGMNLPFARWIAARGAAGDRLDVMVHEPFADFLGGSWIQPVRAAIQRSMTRAVLRAARRVWLSIPGWEQRLLPVLRAPIAPRVLAVPGTIPVDRDQEAVAAVRNRLAGGAARLVGYFGAGGPYVESAITVLLSRIRNSQCDAKLVLIGRGTEGLAARLRDAGVSATGSLESRLLSHHLQACDVLVQPYVDGVSGRRTTTVSALEHSVPVATTFGRLSEPFWRETAAVETVDAERPELLASAVERLCEPHRYTEARAAAAALYAGRFDPRVAFDPLFTD